MAEFACVVELTSERNCQPMDRPRQGRLFHPGSEIESNTDAGNPLGPIVCLAGKLELKLEVIGRITGHHKLVLIHGTQWIFDA